MNTLRPLLFSLLTLVAGFASGLSRAGASYDPMLVTVGIIDNNEPGYRAETVTPTLRRLEEELPEYRFRIVEIAAYQAVTDIGRAKPDFVIAPSDVFLSLINWYGAQAIAMRKTNFASDPAQSSGSTIIVLNSRTDLQQLKDLEGKNIAASLPDSLSGWLALQGELKSQGHDPTHFFKSA